MISKEEIQDFRLEVVEEIESVDSSIFNDLKDSPQEVKNTLLRLLHNTKGTAGMFELHALEKFCHETETNLESVTFTPAIEDGLLQITQVIEQYMNSLDENVLLRPLTFHDVPAEAKETKAPKENKKKDIDSKSEEYVKVMKFSLNELIAQKENEPELEKNEFGHIPNIKTQLKYALIEDEEILAKSVTNILNEYNVSVDYFSTADEFLTKATPEDYHLIITDKNLPGTNGISLIKKVKEKVPLLPILLISGFLNEEALVSASQLGVAGILPKPFPSNLLVRQSYNASLNYLNRILLEKALQTINFTFGAIEYETSLNSEEIKRLKAEIQTINLEMIKIKKYFATIPQE